MSLSLSPQTQISTQLMTEDLPFGLPVMDRKMREIRDSNTYTQGDTIYNEIKSLSHFLDFSKSYHTYDLVVCSANSGASDATNVDRWFLDGGAMAIFEYYKLSNDASVIIDEIIEPNAVYPLLADFISRDYQESIGFFLDGVSNSADLVMIDAADLGAAVASDATFNMPSGAVQFKVEKLNDFRSNTGNADDCGYMASATNATNGVASNTYRFSFKPMGFQSNMRRHWALLLPGASLVEEYRLESTPNRCFAWTGSNNFGDMRATASVTQFTVKNFTFNGCFIQHTPETVQRFRQAIELGPLAYPYQSIVTNRDQHTFSNDTEATLDLRLSAASLLNYMVFGLPVSYGGTAVPAYNPQLTNRCSFYDGGTDPVRHSITIAEIQYPPKEIEGSAYNEVQQMNELLKCMSSINDVTSGTLFNTQNIFTTDSTSTLCPGTSLTHWSGGKTAFGVDLTVYNEDGIDSGINTRRGNPPMTYRITPRLGADLNARVYAVAVTSNRCYLTNQGMQVMR